MIDSKYLAAGLNAMARAHYVNPMAGHLGAAVVAGYFIAEKHPDLDADVYRGIEGELDRIICGESVFSPGENAVLTAPEMFEPFAVEQSKGKPIKVIAEALAGNIDQTRQSGHNVIFASIAIRVFTEHPELATPPVIEGIHKLITRFDDASPGSGYYGKEKGRIDGREVRVEEDHDFPRHASLEAMANAVVDELIQCAPEHRIGFGGLEHVIDHAAGLTELARYAYRELAAKGLSAHHQHMQLRRTLPDVADEHSPKAPTQHDPRTAAFWRSSDIRRGGATLTHRVKTIYGFDALVELVKDESKCNQGNDMLRYLM